MISCQDHKIVSDLKEQFINANGHRFHVVLAGPEDGEPVLLLHGFPEFWYGWRHQIDALAQAGFRVIIPDQRGYAFSDKPKGIRAYRVEELVADTTGLIAACGYERVNLVGHDWGALVAWETAIRFPERVRRLAIFNVPHPDVMSTFLRTHASQLKKSWYIFFFQIPGLPEWLLSRNHFANLRRMTAGTSRPGSFDENDLAKYVEAWQQPGALSAMINWYRALFLDQLPFSHKNPHSGSRRVKPPVIMLWGKQDLALSHAMAPASIGFCDQGTLFLFDQATHWVQHDEAEAVNRHLVNFFQPTADR